MNSKVLFVVVLAFLVVNVIAKRQPSNFSFCMKQCSKENYERSPCLTACKVFRKAELALADVMNFPTAEDMWDRYRTELLRLIAGDKDNEKGLQIVTEELGANWDTQPQTLDQIANRISEYGSIYSPLNRRLSDEYRAFLQNIDIYGKSTSTVDDAKFDALQNKLDNLNDDIDQAKRSCSEAYKAARPHLGGISAEDFERTYCPEVFGFDSEKDRILQQINQMESKTDGNLRDVKLALGAFDKAVKTFTDDGNLKRIVERVKAGKHTNRFEIQMSQDSQIKTVNSWTKTKKSGFIFKKTKTQTFTEIKLAGSKYNMKVSAPVIARIPIYPTKNWLNVNIINKYKNNKSVWLDKNKNFFGEGGSLRMMPTELYVIMNPAVELKVDAEVGHQIEQFKKSSLSFGPFQSGKGSTLNVNKNSDNTYSVSFQTNDDMFQVIAVKNAVF